MSSVDLTDWVLVPFVSFGPVHFAHPLTQIVETLGTPLSQKPQSAFLRGQEVVYRTGKDGTGPELKVWFNGEGRFEFLMFEGSPLLTVRGPTGDEKCDLTKQPHVVKLSDSLSAIAPMGVTVVQKPNSAVRISVNSYEHLKALAPEIPVPPPPPTRKGKSTQKPRSMPQFLKTAKAFKALQRDTFIPVFKRQADDVNRSKLNGAPFTTPQHPPLACPECEGPMSLIVQLFADDLPEELKPRFKGALQYLVCVEGDCHVDLVEGAAQLRVVPGTAKRPSAKTQAKTKRAAADTESQALVITGWKKQSDLPQLYDTEAGLEPEMLAAAKSALVTAFRDEADDYSEHFPRRGSKALGWPDWVQSPDSPACRKCGDFGHMRLLLQITDSEAANLWGTLFIFQCPKHADVFEVVEQST